MSLISAANAPGSDVNQRSSMFMRLALPNSESTKQTALAPSNADKLEKINKGCLESDWADLSTEIMDQIVTLLSDQLMMSFTVWPKDTRIPALQLVCRHWHNAAKPSIKHIPLAQGNDFELGLLLTKFTAAQSLRVRFQALTGKSLAALRNYTNLRRLDLVVDDLNDHYDKLPVKAVFTLTLLEKLKLDVGPLGDSSLSAFDWAALAKLQQLELRVSFKAPHSCYDCLLALPKLDNLCLHHGCPTIQTLQALTRITRLQMSSCFCHPQMQQTAASCQLCKALLHCSLCSSMDSLLK